MISARFTYDGGHFPHRYDELSLMIQEPSFCQDLNASLGELLGAARVVAAGSAAGGGASERIFEGPQAMMRAQWEELWQ